MIVLEVIRRARRRLLWKEMASHGAFTISVALGNLVVLLLFGAQIVDWRWLVVLPILTLAGGVWRAARYLPGSYVTAQLIDGRLNLDDTLSTAIFFMSESGGRGAESACQAQRNQAVRIAENVSLADAVPYTLPRGTYIAILLAVAVGGLFALRYGIEHRLDLRPSLAHLLKLAAGAADTKLAETPREKPMRKDLRPLNTRDHKEGPNAPENPQRAAGDMNAAKRGEGNQESREDNASMRPQNRREQSEEEGTDGESQDGADGQNTAQWGQGAAQSKSQERQTTARQSAGSSSENAGMGSRLQDAMQNMLSRMAQQLSNIFGGQQASGRDGRSGQSRESKAARSRSVQSKQQGGQESSSAEGTNADSPDAQNAASTGAGQSADQQAGNQPGGGIGNQDGSKDTALTEQLAAMGKISRIIGRRSEDVAGEVAIEVRSGNPQISTSYLQKNAEHTNAGGEIHRDEVPLLDRSYVQRYFEEIRRQPKPIAGGSSRTKRGAGTKVPAN